ncbi:hypothetical protein HU200_060344 [Digitaria exilis]|uniref:Uncharacterized protein n=1 Tax=Digitaria exilis TaxID=1010633 RepID=A0A835AEQ7_9POAL|nr:hypothetical protein HU200_060344 [Digitaria exilis]
MSSPSCCSRSPPRCRPSGLLTACAALSSSASCQQASPGQFAVLYAAVCALVVVVVAGTRFTAVTFGADQFGSARDQDTFYIVSLYASCLVGETAIVYLQESVSWPPGPWDSESASVASLAMLLLGARLPEARPSSAQPFARLASMSGSTTARIGPGDVVNISAMVAAALVERRWLGVVHAHHSEDDEAAGKVVATMSILWLFIPLGLVGVGKALHLPGLLTGVPEDAAEHGDGHGAAAHRAGVLLRHRDRGCRRT